MQYNYVFIGVYLVFCLIIALLGRNVLVGFWGVLVISIFLTPLLTAILILFFKPKLRKKKLS